MNTQVEQTSPDRLNLTDGELLFWPQIELPLKHDKLLRDLHDRTDWRQESIQLFGKAYLQPRLIAWYGQQAYRYSGTVLEPKKWTKQLIQIKACVEQVTGKSFNSVLLNYYRNERDSMGMHSDDEPELGENPVIASLSLGATRSFVMKHRTRKEVQPIKLDLPSGSLLLMKGETQHYWKHGINKQRRPCGPRINLTFRTTYSQ